MSLLLKGLPDRLKGLPNALKGFPPRLKGLKGLKIKSFSLFLTDFQGIAEKG